jgi:hypothetical protein
MARPSAAPRASARQDPGKRAQFVRARLHQFSERSIMPGLMGGVAGSGSMLLALREPEKKTSRCCCWPEDLGALPATVSWCSLMWKTRSGLLHYRDLRRICIKDLASMDAPITRSPYRKNELGLD